MYIVVINKVCNYLLYWSFLGSQPTDYWVCFLLPMIAYRPPFPKKIISLVISAIMIENKIANMWIGYRNTAREVGFVWIDGTRGNFLNDYFSA